MILKDAILRAGLIAFRAWGRPPPLPPTAGGPRFLFLQYEKPLGTMAISTATFAALKQHWPAAHIAVATAGSAASLFGACPAVDEVIQTPHGLDRFAAALGFFLKHIRPRRGQFDYVVADGGNQRTKIALLAAASGVRCRIGLTATPDLFHVPLAFDASLSNIENNLRTLGALGRPAGPAEPLIGFRRTDLERVSELLGADSRAPRIAVATQTSKGHPNAWFTDRFIDLSGRLIEQLDARLIFLGAKGDQADIDAMRAMIGAPTLSAAGRTDLPGLAALLSQCDLVITLDTGTLHVARGVDAPTVVLANSAQPANLWLPLGIERHLILRKDYVPCALCMRLHCATRECMQEISVSEVVESARVQLNRFPPSASARAERANARLLA